MERFWFLWMRLSIAIMWSPKMSHAESCPAAIMKASPSEVMHHGHPMNLTCTLTGNTRPCNLGFRGDMKIERQKTLVPGRVKMDSVIVQDLRPPPGATLYECWKCKMLCVITVFAGFPPDQPRSVACEQEGELGKMSCSWESGRETHIETTWTLQLLQKAQIVTVSSLDSSQANQSVVLPVSIAAGGEFTVLVRASNELGENVSMPYMFTYIDAVKPYPPSDITVTCDTPHSCTGTIHTHQDVQHFWLRYRITNESAWKQVEILNNRSRTLHKLRPLSQYEFQAACKYVIDRGKWSNWSGAITHQTPEDAPRGKIAAWYKVERGDKVTVYWKYMHLSEFRGQIRFYQVTVQDNERPGVYVQNSTDTSLSRIIASDGGVITVSAHNSMGSSRPASIRVSTRSQAGFPAPINVIPTTSGPETITLHWELPPKTELADEQVVVWEDPTAMDQSRTNWIIVPKQNRSVTISGHLRPHICYQFYVYLLQGGRAGLPGITRGSTRPTVPSPQSSLHQYKMDPENNVHYSVEMTCSNGAGESPLISDYEKNTDTEDTMAVVFVVVLLVIGFLISISFGEQRLQFFLSRLIPHWWSKSIPDPANCEWAKEYICNQEKSWIIPNTASNISDDEIEALEIEEMDSEDESSPSVFSYKISLPIIRVAQEENTIAPDASCGDVLSDRIIKPAQDCSYRSLQPAHPPSDYLVHQDLKPSNDLVHQDMRASDYLVHQDLKPSNYLVHQDMRASDYLVHSKIKTSSYLGHQGIKPSENSGQSEMEPSDYLVHSKVDYVPTNLFTIMEEPSKERKDQIHHQFLLPTGEKTNNLISLDTVLINFPYGEL